MLAQYFFNRMFNNMTHYFSVAVQHRKVVVGWNEANILDQIVTKVYCDVEFSHGYVFTRWNQNITKNWTKAVHTVSKLRLIPLDYAHYTHQLICHSFRNDFTMTSREVPGVPKHLQLDKLFGSLFRLTTKTQKLQIIGDLWED